jgi:predicted RNase H-like nuclease
LNKRLPYKTSRVSQYWPQTSPRTRWQRLCKNLEALCTALAREISGIDDVVPDARVLLTHGNKSLLKHLEDALDAIVCAWIGYQFWRGCAMAYGDEEAAIWLPSPDFRSKKLVKVSKI